MRRPMHGHLTLAPPHLWARAPGRLSCWRRCEHSVHGERRDARAGLARLGRAARPSRTFLDEGGVEPTNNAAERALCPAVLWREGGFGTQCDDGARFVERLPTVVATGEQHGRRAARPLSAGLARYRLHRAAPKSDRSIAPASYSVAPRVPPHSLS